VCGRGDNLVTLFNDFLFGECYAAGAAGGSAGRYGVGDGIGVLGGAEGVSGLGYYHGHGASDSGTD
jgi:hypothetical protein